MTRNSNYGHGENTKTRFTLTFETTKKHIKNKQNKKQLSGRGGQRCIRVRKQIR